MSATKLSPSCPDDSALIALRDGDVVRGGRLLFQNVSIDVAAGDVVQLAGKNGVGKTSLLRVLAGALPLAGGSLVRRADLRIAYLPADDALWQGTMGVDAALVDWVGAIGITGADIHRALAVCGLAGLATRSVAHLSMGQKRRLSWARIVLQNANLWLLDEPFNSLDDAGLAIVRDLMTAHAARGGSIVAACHEQLPAQCAAHAVRVIDLNRVAA